MPETALNLGSALIELSNAMAPYILFGLLFAGMLHELVPESLVTKHLGSDNVASVAKSTLLGIPLPVCSCGVIPLATSIKKSGASRGATLSFLISTPITGIDSILATYGMFGWIFTLYRIATSIVMAVAAGILTNLFGTPIPSEAPKPRFTAAQAPASHTVLRPSPSVSETSCCSGGCDTSAKPHGFSFTGALRYAFVTLLGDIAAPLAWGLLVGALITVAVPDDLGAMLAGHGWLSYLIVIVIAVPMYVCATASLPIAAGLMLSGVSAGAAFVFLSAGPATNTVTVGVVKKMLGTRALAIYLGVIVTGSVAFGLGLDAVFANLNVAPEALVHLEAHAGFVAMASSVVLWALAGYHLFVVRFLPNRRVADRV